MLLATWPFYNRHTLFFLIACILLSTSFADDKPKEGFEYVDPDLSKVKDAKKEDTATEAPADVDHLVGTTVNTLAALPNRLRNVYLGADPRPDLSNRPSGGFGVRARLAPNIDIPFLQSGKFVREAAEFKFGRLYLDVTEWSLSVLASDNADQTETDKESGTICSTSLYMNLLFEFTEDAYFKTSGALVWLPFEGEAGVDGFGIRDVYSIGLGSLFQADLVIPARVGAWDLILKDELDAVDTRYSKYSGTLEIFEGGDFTGEDVLGTYSMGPGTNYRYNSSLENKFDDEGIEIVNTASLSFIRPLPEQSELRVTPFYRNYWYPDDSDREETDVTREYGVNSAWVFDHAGWRFNPFLLYNQTWNNIDDDWLYTWRIGARGPLTDQIDIYADVGSGDAEQYGIDDEFLWRLGIDHVLGPCSRQRGLWERTIDNREQSLQTNFRYEFDQILGPSVRARLFAGFEDNDFESPAVDWHEDFYGGILYWQVARRVSVGQYELFTRQEYDNGNYLDTDSHKTRAVFILNPRSWVELTYEHRVQKSNLALEETFRENVATLTFVRRF